MPKHETQRTAQVVDHIRRMIETGLLQPGDRLPAERDLARKLRISRASLRTGIGYLAAVGVMDVRHGVGTFVAEGPPEIGKSSLSLLAALHGFQPWQMFEARRILEGEMAALAARRGQESHFAALSEEVDAMDAAVGDPGSYLIHDVRFHRLIAQASGNPILAALMETIASALYDQRQKTAGRSRDLHQSTQLHHAICQAIRTRNCAQARALMERHLDMAESAQGEEADADARGTQSPPRRSAKSSRKKPPPQQ